MKSQADTDGVRFNDLSGRGKNSTSIISKAGSPYSDNSRNKNNEELCGDFYNTDIQNNESVGNLNMKPHM